MDKKPDSITCKVVVDTQLLDKKGKAEHDEHRVGKAKLHGDDRTSWESVTRDGRAMTAIELADERAKVSRTRRRRRTARTTSTSCRCRRRTRATRRSSWCARKSCGGGRRSWSRRRRRSSRRSRPTAPCGSTPRSFLVLKAMLSPSAMPPHADWINVQQQFVPGPKDVAGAVVPAHRGRGPHAGDAQAVPHHAALERLPVASRPPYAADAPTLDRAWHFAGPSVSS